MRVLLFRTLCDTGGVSSSMLLLGQHMAKRGIEYEYWFCKPSNRLPEFMETGRATLGPLSALAARLDRGDVDIIQMTASDPSAELVAQMARSARVVVTARGALADIWNRNNCFAYSAISRGMAQVNQPYTDVEIEVVRNAIDVSRFSPPARSEGGGVAPIIAFIGRTTSVEKDFPRFTRVARRLAERGARIWVADPHEATWDKFQGLPVERVATERWGRVPFSEIPEFYRAVAASGGVVLMTSRTEGFGNVAPEAAACGARVFAPDVMGLREAIVAGVTGTLFPAAASDDEVADQIQASFGAPHDMRAVAEAAQREFSPSVMLDEYLEIYARRDQKLIQHSPPTATGPEMVVLLDHLSRQRGWRASTARAAAPDLARAGYAKLAIGALAIALRAAPRQFVSRSGVRQLISTAWRIAGRRHPPAS